MNLISSQLYSQSIDTSSTDFMFDILAEHGQVTRDVLISFLKSVGIHLSETHEKRLLEYYFETKDG